MERDSSQTRAALCPPDLENILIISAFCRAFVGAINCLGFNNGRETDIKIHNVYLSIAALQPPIHIFCFVCLFCLLPRLQTVLCSSSEYQPHFAYSKVSVVAGRLMSVFLQHNWHNWTILIKISV